MNCNEIKESFNELLDGILAPAYRDTLETHLTACSACRAELERMQMLRMLLRADETPLPSVSLDERVMRAFRERHGAADVNRAWWHRLVRSSLNIPAAALAMLVLTFATALVAFRLGEISATSIVITSQSSTYPPVALPTPLPRATDTLLPTVRYVRVTKFVAVATSAKHAPVRRASRKSEIDSPPRLESAMLLSGSGADLSTTVRLEGFEPVQSATPRILEGGNK